MGNILQFWHQDAIPTAWNKEMFFCLFVSFFLFKYLSWIISYQPFSTVVMDKLSLS